METTCSASGFRSKLYSNHKAAGLLRLTRGTSTLALSAALLMGVNAHAQSEPEDEVIVTGIRSSLEQSADIKRNSSGVVDAITAEDIGKFPDTNLAESLQRIPGVAINRVNGEGSEVTVRGFGAEFNQVTLNGRTMPTADVVFLGGGEFTDGTNTRAFDFSNIASEGVSGLEVFKTGRASISSGGLGATVNVKTWRPLETSRNGGTIGVKALHDTTVVHGDDITPEISGLYNYSNDENTFGVSVFGSYQKRDSGAPSVTQSLFDVFTAAEFADPVNGQVRPTTNITGLPTDPNALVTLPRNAGAYAFADYSRERLNGSAVVQFQASDALRLTADVTYVEQQESESRYEASNWFNLPFTDVVFDDSPVIASATFLAEDIANPTDFAFTQYQNDTKDTLQSIGFNADWDFRDNMRIILDAHTSKAESAPNGVDGVSQYRTGIAAPVVIGRTLTNTTDDIPFHEITIDDRLGNGNGVIDLEDIGSSIARQEIINQENKIDQFDLRNEWSFDEDSLVTLGAGYRTASNQTTSVQRQQTLGNWGIENPGDVLSVAPGSIELFCVTCQFSDFTAPTTGPVSTGIRGNAAELFQALSPFYASNFDRQVGVNRNDNEFIEEDILSFYGQLDTEFDLGSIPASLSVGIRYEDTQLTSRSLVAVPTAIQWDGDNDFRVVIEGNEVENVTTDFSYDNFMPHVDLKLDVRDDMVLRASYSNTIARAGYGLLSSNNSPGTPPGPTALGAIAQATGSNPELLPLDSDNFDISFEWYFDDTSYISIGAFEKRVSNFIGNGTRNLELFGLRDPSSGLAGTRSGQALAALRDGGFDAGEINLFALTALIEREGSLSAALAEFSANLDANGFYDITNNPLPAVRANANDPLFTFLVSGPVNNEEGKINGIEIAGQHFFGETGFGIAGSYTLVNGDVDVDRGGDPEQDQFALTGLSDTANVTLIYEKHGISARASYNWRDDYVETLNFGPGRSPRIFEAFGQFDASISYDLMDNLVLSLEAINLNGENVRVRGRRANNVWYAQELGPRYSFGARYKF